MKPKLNQWQLLCLILSVGIFIVANGFIAASQGQDAQIASLQAQLQQPQQSNRISINEPMTLIRSTEDYIYLNKLEIDRDTLEHATKHTDINGITWYEIIDDGYIKVYAEGHIMPDSIHWYSPY